jgi:hypothetical protein
MKWKKENLKIYITVNIKTIEDINTKFEIVK